MRAVRCAAQCGGTWEVTGPDSDGDELTVIVVIDDGVLVVTFFGPR
jgi:hypothetical protein